MIHDPKKRPVYSQEGSFWKVYTYQETVGHYECEESEIPSLEEVLEKYPTAVKAVNRRTEKAKRRHPDVHYRPAFRPIACWHYQGFESPLTEETYRNAKVSSDVSRVTCRVCLDVIEALVRARKVDQ
jgi:hypothetical protein